MGKFVAFLALLMALAISAAWFSRNRQAVHAPLIAPPTASRDESWLADLHSQNPRQAEKASQRVAELGPQALPVVRETLQNPRASRDERKAALKACAVLGQTAAPAISDVARVLADPDLATEAAVALSFMGPAAFPPLREALHKDPPVVRREALRSIGKLQSRAPIESRAVVPLLLEAMKDTDDSVRTVAVTYLGILHDNPELSVPVLIAALDDPAVGVRRAAATALGSFGAAAEQAIPALQRAAGDPDEDLAREAGRAIVKLQSAARAPQL